MSSDLPNIVLPIYILTAKYKKAWVSINNTLSNTQLGAGSFIVKGGFITFIRALGQALGSLGFML